MSKHDLSANVINEQHFCIIEKKLHSFERTGGFYLRRNGTNTISAPVVLFPVILIYLLLVPVKLVGVLF